MEELYIPASMGKLFGIFQSSAESSPLIILSHGFNGCHLGNQDFAFKKSVLSKTLHIRMNTELLKKDTWTVRDILQRCDEMADQIIAIYPYEPGKASIEMTKNDNVIILTAPTVNARALYVNPQCIEILAGTTMKAYGPQEMKSMRSLFRDMTEKGILGETETGRIQFEKNYRFHDLNTAAQFLLHRGGDNTAMWTRENGSPLPEAKPAEKTDAKAQGLEAGDIITKANGADVRTTEDLANIKADLETGDTIALTLWRDGAVRTREIRLIELSDYT